MTTGYRYVSFEVRGRVGILTLNRPAALNALHLGIIDEIRAVLRTARDDAAVRAVVITGAGRGFCAGADLSAPDTSNSTSMGETVSDNMDSHFNPVVHDIDAFPKPVIAAVNGVAAGGGVGVALAADIVIAAESASFIQVFAPRLGIIPDMGSTWYLTHLLGRARARALALTGEALPARRAEAWGLIWKCVPDDALMAEAMDTAERVAAVSSVAARMTMQALDAAMNNGLAEQLDLERYMQARMANRPAFREGIKAFAEKREPDFSDD